MRKKTKLYKNLLELIHNVCSAMSLTHDKQNPVRVTSISYSVSSDGNVRDEKLSVRVYIPPQFLLRKIVKGVEIYETIASNVAKNILCSGVVGFECTKAGDYFTYLSINHSDGTRHLYVEFLSLDQKWRENDIGKFMTNYIEQCRLMQRAKLQIVNLVKQFGRHYPCIAKKIKTVKEMKKNGEELPCALQLSDRETELSDMMGVVAGNRSQLVPISNFLFP